MTLLGLPPLARPTARLLILGSMPGGQSLARQQYYAHPRNLFWPLMYQALAAGDPASEAYPQRCQRLLAQDVALWDVLQRCRRAGSLDSQIERDSEEANDLARFLQQHTGIDTLVFNGAAAEQLFRRHLLRAHPDWQHSYRLLRLPSTSPANAGQSHADKLTRWAAAVWCRHNA